MAIMPPEEAGEERKSDGEFIFHTMIRWSLTAC
jgi:hypothetical protein